mmetsp:Transcript_1428/g.3896  ORF Transcript_1428/g.3896 Transcript_1428/m.3896 type:complete len:221 (+) Transcript_1428:1274-1936(+)
MSVQKSATAPSFSANFSKTTMRFVRLCRPWSSMTAGPGFSFQKASYKNLTCLQAETKMIIFCLECDRMKENNTSIFFSSGTFMYTCLSFSGVRLFECLCTLTSSGDFRAILPKRWTLACNVAEKSIDCLLSGRPASMCSIVSWNPKSKIRSASSKTSTRRFPASKPGDSSRCCKNRPGVATKMHISDTNACSSSMLLPPTMQPAENSCFWPKSCKTLKVW